MRINEIKLFNFGSYEGLNTISTKINKKKNIVLFGGKNGAGKTTLFNSIGLCMYGPISLGCNTQNNRYFNKIKSFLNNKALMNGEKNAYIEVDISLENGRDLDNYVLIRKWEIEKNVKEDFIVFKNGDKLEKQQIADFEKYIFSIIPPDLFNLYFFDGETITDFFMDEDGNKKFKQAFLTLCGYDTFEIMHNNFKRNSLLVEKNNQDYIKYTELKEKIDHLKEEIEVLKEKQILIFNELNDCDADEKILDDKFYTSGGVTDTEWNKLDYKIKEEERKREEWNYSIKKWANDIVPFLMIKESIKKLGQQIDNENNNTKIDGFIEILESKDISKYLSKIDNDNNVKNKLIEIANKQKKNKQSKILNYSYEQTTNTKSLINHIINFDEHQLYEYKKNIKDSIALTTKIRKKMETLSAGGSSEYINKKKEIISKRESLFNEKIETELKLNELLLEYKQTEPDYKKSQETVENSIKKESISDISIKASMMLEKLQKKLFDSQINKLINNFKANSSYLLNKKDLISDISIDDDFKIHVYQDVKIAANKLANIIQSHDKNFDYIVNDKTKKAISKIAGVKSKDINEQLKSLEKKTIKVPVEINFERLSAGERQMFIMSLYLSLVQLGNIEIPFIIDTPFARIDLEHRENISKYFFSRLDGQVFILSTNKEIDEKHIDIIKGKISKIYTLKNLDKSRTEIIDNYYFGEKYDI